MNLEKEDKIITEFLQSIGLWRNHIVISGGYALFIYKLYLSDQKLKNPPIGTRDIDSLIPRKVPEISKKNLSKHLLEAGFTPIFKNRDIPATEAYVKEINGIEVEVEFLTDTATRDDKNKSVKIAGVVAQPLSYLELSLKMTMEFQTYSRETGKVVSPGTWMFHKSLTFAERKKLSKMHKDLYGIWYVATQLGDFSEQAITEYKRLSKDHPKWFKTLQNNLFHWMENASPYEWSQLETQDPSGKLKKLHFERTIKELTLPNTSLHSVKVNDTSKTTLGTLIADLKGKELMEKVKKALAAGANLNDNSRNGHRPLQMALAKGHTEVARLLIEKGADLHHRDRSGKTPLQTAINHGQFQNAKLLIKKGVPFNRNNTNLEFDYVKHHQFTTGN